MIATNEIGHAYGIGNNIPIKDAISNGAKAKKQWLTSNDDRVTSECLENQSQGWIDFDKEFSSSDMYAPRADHPRCRCGTLYEIN